VAVLPWLAVDRGSVCVCMCCLFCVPLRPWMPPFVSHPLCGVACPRCRVCARAAVPAPALPPAPASAPLPPRPARRHGLPGPVQRRPPAKGHLATSGRRQPRAGRKAPARSPATPAPSSFTQWRRTRPPLRPNQRAAAAARHQTAAGAQVAGRRRALAGPRLRLPQAVHPQDSSRRGAAQTPPAAAPVQAAG
jgi:hypothetical protein